MAAEPALKITSGLLIPSKMAALEKPWTLQQIPFEQGELKANKIKVRIFK